MAVNYKVTIPNDYGSAADYALLETWCESMGIDCTDDAIFDAVTSLWPGAECTAVGDFHRVFENLSPPDIADFPPLWVSVVDP